MNFIILTDMKILMVVCSDMIVLIFPYLGVTMHADSG